MLRPLPSIRPPVASGFFAAKKIKLGLSVNAEEGIVYNIGLPGGKIGHASFPGHWLIPFPVPYKTIDPRDLSGPSQGSGPLPGLDVLDALGWLAIVLHDPLKEPPP